jgi:hypothetical protein
MYVFFKYIYIYIYMCVCVCVCGCVCVCVIESTAYRVCCYCHCRTRQRLFSTCFYASFDSTRRGFLVCLIFLATSCCYLIGWYLADSRNHLHPVCCRVYIRITYTKSPSFCILISSTSLTYAHTAPSSLSTCDISLGPKLEN